MKKEVTEVVISEDVNVPIYSSEGAAGFDFYSPVDIMLDVPKVVTRYKNPKFNRKEPVSDSNKYYLDTEGLHSEQTYEEVQTVVFDSHVVNTGVAFKLDELEELEVRGRSGLGIKHSIDLFNGTVDSDYRGNVHLKLTNNSNQPYFIKKGERIGQGIIKEIKQKEFVVVDKTDGFCNTVRGEGKFGHTGK